MNIGFFGGSFSPPTIAHINLAKKALEECKLDKIIFVPIGDFYEKKDLLPFKDRFNMLKIASTGEERIEISDLEKNIKEKVYAIDIFRIIEKKYPNDNIYFIMGADNFVKITSWKEYKTLTKKYKYIILDRENININKYIKEMDLDCNNIAIIKNKEHNTSSSSKFRKNLKERNTDFKNLVSEEVYEYIMENKLFS